MLTALLIAGTAFWGWAIIEILNDDEEDEDLDQDLIGTSGPDTLTGGDGNDLLKGNGDDDLLRGNAGSVQVQGKEGADIGLGGTGDDVLRGAESADLLLGEDGDDRVFGDKERDWAEGGAGDDEVAGGEGDDIAIGGEGEDTVKGGNGSDFVFGGNFLERSLTVDELEAVRAAQGAGEPVEFPEDASPLIVDDGAADVLDGGRGDDLLFVGKGDNAGGGAGTDTFYLLGGDLLDPAEITDYSEEDEDLVYVYDEGADAPEIAFVDNGDGTQTMTADGETVALIQSSLTLTADNVVLYERGSDDTALI